MDDVEWRMWRAEGSAEGDVFEEAKDSPPGPEKCRDGDDDRTAKEDECKEGSRV